MNVEFYILILALISPYIIWVLEQAKEKRKKERERMELFKGGFCPFCNSDDIIKIGDDEDTSNKGKIFCIKCRRDLKKFYEKLTKRGIDLTLGKWNVKAWDKDKE